MHGYLIDDAERIPDKGILTYRGMNVRTLWRGAAEGESLWIRRGRVALLFGKQPTARNLKDSATD